MTNQKVLYPTDELILAINKMFNEKLFKGDIIRELNEEFERKGLNPRTIQLLMNEQINLDNLKQYELLAIGKIAFNHLQWKELNPSRYFGNNVLVNYENKIKTEEKIDIIELKNFIKIDEFNYRGQIDYKDIYNHLNYNNFIYDHDAQRSPKYRVLGSKRGKGKKIRVENLNLESVEQICNAVLDKTFEDTEIILNCEIIKGKKSRFKFINSYCNEILSVIASKNGIDERKLIKDLESTGFDSGVIGDIIIKPNYDMESDTTTWVSITDGFHRCKGIVLAVSRHLEQTGQMLEGSIGVRLVRADKERAKRIVHQTFLRSSDEPEWVNALESSDYSRFVDLVLKNSKRLTVGNTVEEAEVNNKLTSKSLLIDVTKKMNIAFNDLAEVNFNSNYMANNFDLIFDMSQKVNIKITPYKAIGYYYLAYRMLENEELNLVNILKELEDNKQFVSNKNNNLNKIINAIEEVIAND